MPTLILTPRFTEDAQALWTAASQLGWGVERLATWRVPEDLKSAPEPVLYLRPDANASPQAVLSWIDPVSSVIPIRRSRFFPWRRFRPAPALETARRLA